MSNEPLTLRPHHGMCLTYFTGHGYSGAFSAHMAATLAALTPERPVRLAAETDEICSACPNNEGGLCSRPERVAGYDRAVLELCGLAEGQVLPFGAFTGLVQEKILAAGLRPGICKGCQWNEVCASHASRWA